MSEWQHKEPTVLNIVRLCAWLLMGLTLASAPSWAQLKGGDPKSPIQLYEKKAGYDDVRFDLTNAIINAGLNIATNGKLNDMLERTGEAVGSTRRVYTQAEFFTFCSAKLTREMVEADVRNIAFCPTTVFIYEAVANPGVVVVGYRRPVAVDPGSTKAVADTQALLDKIVREAVR